MRPINSWFWIVHRRTCLPPVRQFQEVFAVRMCKAYPQIFLPSAVKVRDRSWCGVGHAGCEMHSLVLTPSVHFFAFSQELSDFRLPGQVLCSLLVVAGHALIGKEGELIPIHAPGTAILGIRPQPHIFSPWIYLTFISNRCFILLLCMSGIECLGQRTSLFNACLPWMVGTHVMVSFSRLHSFVPCVVHAADSHFIKNTCSRSFNISSDVGCWVLLVEKPKY